MEEMPVPTITINVVAPDDERMGQDRQDTCSSNFSPVNSEIQPMLFATADYSTSPTSGFIQDSSPFHTFAHDPSSGLRNSQLSLECFTNPALLIGALSDASGELFLSPDHQTEMGSERSSPIDSSWSPTSSSSGEFFTDNASDLSSIGHNPSHPSSRSHSPHSPIHFNLSLEDPQQPQFSFSGNAPSSASRHRSSSFNGRVQQESELPLESRPRSASVSTSSGRPGLTLDVSLLPFAGVSTHEFSAPPLSGYDSDMSPVPSMAMSPVSPHETALPSPSHGRSASWGGTDNGLYLRPNAELLQVPALQRRNAHRKSMSHGVASRGRSRQQIPIGLHQHNSNFGPLPADSGFLLPETVTEANLFPDVSGGQAQDFSSFMDNELSPSSDTLDPTNILDALAFIDGYSSDSSYSGHPSPVPSVYSPSITTVHSPTPSFASTSSSSTLDLLPDFNFSVIPPEDGSDTGAFGRRNTYTISRPSSSQSDVGPSSDLQRTVSDPMPSRGTATGKRRKVRQLQRGSVAGMTGVFRSEIQQGSLTATANSSPGGSTMLSDIRGPSPSTSASSMASSSRSSSSSQDPPFKRTVASKKICAAAKKRRKTGAAGAHVCDICGQDFTTKHNLNYHMDSHSGEKKYECQFCGQKSVHPHVIKRHIQNSCKKKPDGYVP